MKNNFSEVNINDIEVLCVTTQGVKGSGEAFKKLESKLSTLKRRKFYGVLAGSSNNGTYRACVGIVQNDNIDGAEKWTIPGGKYARAKIQDWEKHLDLIAQIFSRMGKGFNVDAKRPSIEFYRSQKVLILLLPIY